MSRVSGLTLGQEKALALIPKFTSMLSIPSSSFIIYEIYSDYKRHGTNSVQRILLGMSIVDILASSAWFMSTWAVPKGDFAYSSGNMASCNVQGFLLQLAVGAPLYNSSLALFYTLMIKRRWTEDGLRQIERWVHGFILTFTLGTSVLLLFLDQYNQVAAICWVIGYPQNCGNSSFQPGDVPCERGNWAWAWGLALFYGPLWIGVIACTLSMVVLYVEVRATLRRARQYTASLGATHSLRRSGRDSSKVATQAILYSLSFVITWMPSTLWSIAHWFNWSHYGLDVAAAVAEPLQGFWNLLVFLRSRPNTVRKIMSVLASIFPCCCSMPDEPTSSTSRSNIGSNPPSTFSLSIRNRIKNFAALSGMLDNSKLDLEVSGISSLQEDGIVPEKRKSVHWQHHLAVADPDILPQPQEESPGSSENLPPMVDLPMGTVDEKDTRPSQSSMSGDESDADEKDKYTRQSETCEITEESDVTTQDNGTNNNQCEANERNRSSYLSPNDDSRDNDGYEDETVPNYDHSRDNRDDSHLMVHQDLSGSSSHDPIETCTHAKGDEAGNEDALSHKSYEAHTSNDLPLPDHHTLTTTMTIAATAQDCLENDQDSIDHYHDCLENDNSHHEETAMSCETVPESCSSLDRLVEQKLTCTQQVNHASSSSSKNHNRKNQFPHGITS